MRTVEFFFDIGSAYSYLAASQIDALAARAGAEARWRPFLLGGVFKATGNEMPARVPAKAAWLAGDFARWAAKYKIPFRVPSLFPLNTLRTQRALTAAGRLFGEEPQRRLSRAVFTAYWGEDRDVSGDATLAEIASSLGLDGAALAGAIDAPETKEELRRATDEAVARGAFGAPTFFVGDQMFFGNDRLEFVEEELKRR